MKRISRGKNLEDDLKAVTHLVPNAFGPRTFGPPQLVPNWLVPLDKRSPTNSVPMEKWSPKIWCPWTNGPQPQFGPPGQMVLRIFRLTRGKGCGHPGIRGPNWLGTFCSVFITFLSTDEFGDFVALLPTTVVEKFAPVEYVEPSCFCCCCILDSCCLCGCWTKRDQLGLDFGLCNYLACMSDQSVLLSKWSPNWRTILAK